MLTCRNGAHLNSDHVQVCDEGREGQHKLGSANPESM